MDLAAAGFTEALTFALVYYVDFIFFLIARLNSDAIKTAEGGLKICYCINVPASSSTVLAANCLLGLWNHSIIFGEFVGQRN